MKHSTFALLVVLLVGLASTAIFAQTGFTVGTATAPPGEKATGFLEVPAGVDTPIADRDIILMGRWTRITVRMLSSAGYPG